LPAGSAGRTDSPAAEIASPARLARLGCGLPRAKATGSVFRGGGCLKSSCAASAARDAPCVRLADRRSRPGDPWQGRQAGPRLRRRTGRPGPSGLEVSRCLVTASVCSTRSPGRLADERRLQRPHQPRRAVPPAGRRAARQMRDRRHRRHPLPDRRPGQPQHPDQGTGRRDRRAARQPRRRAHLHLAAPLRHGPRRPPADRDRRLPRQIPRPRVVDLPGRAAPPTRQSGKHKAVTFRWPPASNSTAPCPTSPTAPRHDNPWAARIYHDAIARGKDHPHAIRILARAWLHVIWHYWHDGIPYQSERHKNLQRLLAEHETAAA
jgi:hypothetical protein